MTALMPIINRSALRAGDIICRRGTGALSKAILWATKGAWSHDAIVVMQDGVPAIGDALLGQDGTLTHFYEWEHGCRVRGERIIVLRLPMAGPTHGEDAAAWWMKHVHGKKYDTVGIAHLGVKILFGDWVRKCGFESRFYCTEGVRDAWKHGGGVDPWWPKDHVTPGTTYKRLTEGRLVEVEEALTEEGRKYGIEWRTKTA